MKCHLLTLVSALALLLCLGSCNRAEDVRVTLFEVVSITPKGMSGMDALVKVGFHNPGVAFEITDAVGAAYLKDDPCLVLTTDQIVVSARCDTVYSVPVHGRLADGFNPLQLLQLLDNQLNIDDITLSVKAKIALRGGLGKVIDLKNIPLSRLMNKKESKQ